MEGAGKVAETIEQHLQQERRQEALALFDQHPAVHASLPLSTFKGLLQAGNDLLQGDRTLRVWEALHATPLRPDDVCFSQHIKALGLLRRPKEARSALTAMRHSMQPDVFCYSACVSALCGTPHSPQSLTSYPSQQQRAHDARWHTVGGRTHATRGHPPPSLDFVQDMADRQTLPLTGSQPE